MNIDNVIAFWRPSLIILMHREQRTLYFLGTLNLLKRSLITLGTYFWWLYFFVLILLSVESVTFCESILLKIVFLKLFLLLSALMLYASVMSLRPSVEIKNYAYFYHYRKAVLVTLVLSFTVHSFLLIPVTLMTLFFLDTSMTFNSMVFSVKRSMFMITKCLPVFLLITCLSVLFSFGLSMIEIQHYTIVTHVIALLINVIRLIGILLIQALVTVYYLKLKHEQFNLFFE